MSCWQEYRDMQAMALITAARVLGSSYLVHWKEITGADICDPVSVVHGRRIAIVQLTGTLGNKKGRVGIEGSLDESAYSRMRDAVTGDVIEFREAQEPRMIRLAETPVLLRPVVVNSVPDMLFNIILYTS